MEYTETATITTAVQGTERYAGFLDLLGRTFNEQSRQAVMEAFEMARTALDGMVNRITEVVSGELKINIRSMSLSPMRDGKIGGTINIEVPSTAVVDMVAANLMRIKGVEKAYRVTQQ